MPGIYPLLLVATAVSGISGYAPPRSQMKVEPPSSSSNDAIASSRRSFVSKSVAFALGTASASSIASLSGVGHSGDSNLSVGGTAEAIGPIKIDIVNPSYVAAPCPKDKPIPGEKAMKGMRGLCVQVQAELAENSPRDLEKVGIYGYVDDAESTESVLANNPDSGTDAGQFAIIPEIKKTDKKIEFEFIAAVPMEKDISKYEDGIGPLNFKSLRIVSFPGGQQYGAISPCEMNEFSSECEEWEEENGPYQRGEFMTKSNPRTKGR